MWHNVGGNGAGREARWLFVGGASYGIGVSRGVSCGIGKFGIAQAGVGAKDKQRQEEAAADERRADNERFMARCHSVQRDVEIACACARGLVVITVMRHDVENGVRLRTRPCRCCRCATQRINVVRLRTWPCRHCHHATQC